MITNLVFYINICPCFDQHFDDITMTILIRAVKGRLIVLWSSTRSSMYDISQVRNGKSRRKTACYCQCHGNSRVFPGLHQRRLIRLPHQSPRDGHPLISGRPQYACCHLCTQCGAGCFHPTASAITRGSGAHQVKICSQQNSIQIWLS